jgi:hypothetical protein
MYKMYSSRKRGEEMTKAEQFARLNGVKPQRGNYYGGAFHDRYPLYQDAKSVLEVMMKRDDWEDFILNYDRYEIWLQFILNPDKLLDEAIKWCEVKK